MTTDTHRPDDSESAASVAQASGPIYAGVGAGANNTTATHVDEAGIDTAELAALLAGRWAKEREYGRRVGNSPEFHRPFNMTKEEHRDLTLANLKKLTELGWGRNMLPESLGGSNDPGGNIAAFEELVVGDPSLQIKAGVQFGLFASAILNLGTEEHHEKWLPGAMSLQTPGIYAMTEIGHGSDVSALGTTATYDDETDEFVINTPFEAATKAYLGNAALHGIAAAVFAQLITKGVNHGVHCFYVPVRDENGNPLEGITFSDHGNKGGLNGIDNGRITFDHVRIPRTNLLNRYGDVAGDGSYSSPIDSPGRRFFTMLSTLVQGRVSLAGAALKAGQIGLGVALTYSTQRRQFADYSGLSEVVLLDYQVHQKRLLPLLAKHYAAAFAQEQMLQAFHAVFSGEDDSEETRIELETLAAALKPNATWLALDTLQECREATGGAGFMAENRIAPLHQDMDVYVTFEGDNHVLLQLVGKRLLTEYAQSMKGMDAADVRKFIANRAEVISTRYIQWRQMVQSASDMGSVRRSAASLRDPELQMELISTRARLTVEELSLDLRQAQNMNKADAAELFNSHQVDLIDAARAHIDLLLLSAYNEALEEIQDEQTRAVVRRLRDLYALTTIQDQLAWYLMHGLLSHGRARTLGDYINRLLAKVRPHALPLIEAFGYTQEHWRAPISSGDEERRQNEAKEYYRRRRASQDAPVDEKVLKAREKKGHSSR